MPLFVPTRILCECSKAAGQSRITKVLGTVCQIRLGVFLIVWITRMDELQITWDVNPNRTLAECLFVAVETLQIILTPPGCIQ